MAAKKKVAKTKTAKKSATITKGTQSGVYVSSRVPPPPRPVRKER